MVDGWSSYRRLFHAAGPAERKPRSPNLVLVQCARLHVGSCVGGFDGQPVQLLARRRYVVARAEVENYSRAAAFRTP